MNVTRRSFLGVAGVLLVTGCRPHRPRRTTAPAADMAAVEAALSAERAIVSAFDGALVGVDPVAAGALTAARDRHLAHVAALTAAVATDLPSPTPAPSPATGPPATLVAQSVAALQQAAVTAVEGSIAAVLASVAAEHAADGVATARPEGAS